MGSNQSYQEDRATTTAQESQEITVVNPSPSEACLVAKVILPSRVLPILSIEGHMIDPNRHPVEVRLNQQSWIDFVNIIERFSHSRAELVTTRQSQLQEKLQRVDEHVQRFTDSYINGSHKALARMNSECKKLDEMKKMLEKCTLQSELCVDMLEKLNFLLPQDLRLEPIRNKDCSQTKDC